MKFVIQNNWFNPLCSVQKCAFPSMLFCLLKLKHAAVPLFCFESPNEFHSLTTDRLCPICVCDTPCRRARVSASLGTWFPPPDLCLPGPRPRISAYLVPAPGSLPPWSPPPDLCLPGPRPRISAYLVPAPGSLPPWSPPPDLCLPGPRLRISAYLVPAPGSRPTWSPPPDLGLPGPRSRISASLESVPTRRSGRAKRIAGT